MDNFNPASLSPEAFAKLAVPSADEVRRKRLEAAGKPAEPVDEIAAAEREEAAERAGLKQAPAAIMPSVSTNPKPNPERIRVTFELTGGYYTVPALGVKECKYGIMVLMPMGANDASFAPAPGSEVTVHWSDKQQKCFSPGIMFELAELECLAIVLIRAQE